MTAGYSLCAVLLFMLALSVAIHRLIVYKQRALTWFLSLVLRALAALLRTFYVSVLAVFVTLFACTPQRVLASNPAQACVGSSSSNIHMAGGVVFALLAAGIAALLALSGATPSMLSRDLLAAASSSSLLLIQGLNTSIVLAALLFPYNLPLQSLLLLLLFTARLWVALRRLPFHAGWVNVVFVGGAAAQAYASLLYIIRVNGGSASSPGTAALMYGLPVAAAAGSAAAGALLARARAVGKRYVAAARDALEQQQQQAAGAAAVVSIAVAIEFADPNAPLIAARVVRSSPTRRAATRRYMWRRRRSSWLRCASFPPPPSCMPRLRVTWLTWRRSPAGQRWPSSEHAAAPRRWACASCCCSCGRRFSPRRQPPATATGAGLGWTWCVHRYA